ncbi:glycosyl transferase family 90-domain-containing protein [Phlebopus sp. FC_14]|nr:glycosyl transferase family 90-domain-containing protein [Phlebopus sp. FC_14]
MAHQHQPQQPRHNHNPHDSQRRTSSFASIVGMVLGRRSRRTCLLPTIVFGIALLIVDTLRRIGQVDDDISVTVAGSGKHAWQWLSSMGVALGVGVGVSGVDEPEALPDVYAAIVPEVPQVPPLSAPHIFRPDGLLAVNPQGRHPILDLIEDAERKWNEKLDRASKTFDQAVQEYRRRYHRPPPPGFDRWWAYVRKHHVQLPDEYDQIYRDLEPFWGIDPADLKAIQVEWEDHQDSYTLGKSEHGPLHIVAERLPNDPEQRRILLTGAYQMIELLQDVEHLLPAFRAVFSPHDAPNIFLSHEMKSAALDAAASNAKMRLRNLPHTRLDGWLAACPPDSPARMLASPASPPPPNDTKTFIHDHRATMDPCQHPALFHIHGQFLLHEAGPTPSHTLVPQFSYSATAVHGDIHVAPTISWIDDLSRPDDPEFEARGDGRLLWRGSTTGISHEHRKAWMQSHRERLVEWANEGGDGTVMYLSPGPVSVSVSESDDRPPNDDGDGFGMGNATRAGMNEALMDVAFSGPVLACEEELCRVVEEKYRWGPRQSIAEAGRYKYVLDVDGNGWSSRFKRLMTSNALVFKSTIFPEWFTDRIAPWVHYVPIQVDYSDLYDAMVFFRGDLDGTGAHEDVAARMARQGREWSRGFWRREDMVAYMFRLFLEYARVMDVDRDGALVR